jgi:menaquinone-9 beta-reductase
MITVPPPFRIAATVVPGAALGLAEMANYDVLIIGAGPAGSASAVTLARSGAKVLIIDRHAFPRDKVCGGLLTTKSLHLVEKDLGLDVDDIHKLVLHHTTGFEIHTQDGLVNRAFGPSPLYFTSRRQFDDYLLTKALGLGCHFAQMRATHLPTTRTISLPTGVHSFDYIIGAYGASSFIPNPFGRGIPKQKLAFGLHIHVPTARVYKTDQILPRVYFGYLPFGWAWVFPKGLFCDVGIAGLQAGQNARENLNRFCRSIGLAYSNKDDPPRGAWIPYGTYDSTPAEGNVFLVGDSAGFVEPITGEGIYYALLSGVLAARALLSNHTDKARAYIASCRQRITRELWCARVCRPLLFCPPLSHLSIRRLKHNRRHMERYLRLLAGEITYPGYFREMFLRL